MPGQTRKNSALEVGCNYASGFLLATLITVWPVIPLMRWMILEGYTDIVVSLAMTTLFTIVSIIRSYFFRRLFNRL